MAAALPAGAVLFAEAVAISPELIEVSAAGAAVVAIAIDIAPTLINIGGSDKAGVAIGVGVTPTLIGCCHCVAHVIVTCLATNLLLSTDICKQWRDPDAHRMSMRRACYHDLPCHRPPADH